MRERPEHIAVTRAGMSATVMENEREGEWRRGVHDKQKERESGRVEEGGARRTERFERQKE